VGEEIKDDLAHSVWNDRIYDEGDANPGCYDFPVFGAHKSRGTTLGINKYNGTPGTDVGHLEILAERRQLRQILSYAFYADQGSRPDVEH